MNTLNGNNDFTSELDDILAEVKKVKANAQSVDAVIPEADEKAEEEPSKKWSIDDIDRLIAETNGEVYVPPKKDKPTPAEDFANILSREFDTGIFTLKPLNEVQPEIEDISSMSEDYHEVEGQETFFEKEEEFNEADFEIETVIVPEDLPRPSGLIFAWQEAEKKLEPKPAPEIKPFYEGGVAAADFFKKREETQEAEKEEPVEEEPVHIEEKDYKTRFFTTLKLERTAEVEVEEDGPVDKPGIVIEKSQEPAENGLEAMPRVLTAENAKELDEEKTRVIDSSKPAQTGEKQEDDNVEGQIMLTGFEDIRSESSPDQVNESDVEEALWKKRKQKAKDFKLIEAIDLDEEFEGDFEVSAEEQAKEERARRRALRKEKFEKSRQAEIKKPVSDEYGSVEERTAVHRKLVENNSKATKNLIAVGAICFVMVVFNIIPAIAQNLSFETGFFSQGSVGLNVFNAVMLIAAVAVNSSRFVSGFKSLLKGVITNDTAVSLSCALALLQNTVQAVFGGDAGSSVFSVAAVFAVLITKITEKSDAQRILGNFEVCAYKYEHNMYAVHLLDNEAEIFEIGKGLMMGNADLLYSSQLSFPTDFVKNSQTAEGGGKLLKILVPAAGAASLIAAIAAGIVNSSFSVALSAFAGTFCITAPVLSAFIPAFILRTANFNLNATGTMVVGLGTAERVACANAVIMDSADIFDRKKCTMHGMKDFKNIRIDDVLLYAAALVIKSGGPLRDCFEQVIDGRQELLPPIKELVYEDKLGIAARIHNQKVLLGNRNLLANHNIEVPDKSVEDRYSHSGRKVMYLAVAGKIAALFVVSYAVDKNLEGYFKTLESNGMQVLVRTNDVNVTEELISKSFGLPQQTFKVLSSVAGRLFKRRRDAVCDKLPASIIHDGTAFSMLRAVSASCSMSTQLKFASVFQILVAALGFILSVALYCTGNAGLVNGLMAALFLFAALAVSVGLVILGKIK